MDIPRAFVLHHPQAVNTLMQIPPCVHLMMIAVLHAAPAKAEHEEIPWEEERIKKLIEDLAQDDPVAAEIAVVWLFKTGESAIPVLVKSIDDERILGGHSFYRGFLFQAPIDSSAVLSNYSPSVGMVCAYLIDAILLNDPFFAVGPYPTTEHFARQAVSVSTDERQREGVLGNRINQMERDQAKRFKEWFDGGGAERMSDPDVLKRRWIRR